MATSLQQALHSNGSVLRKVWMWLRGAGGVVGGESWLECNLETIFGLLPSYVLLNPPGCYAPRMLDSLVSNLVAREQNVQAGRCQGVRAQRICNYSRKVARAFHTRLDMISSCYGDIFALFAHFLPDGCIISPGFNQGIAQHSADITLCSTSQSSYI